MIQLLKFVLGKTERTGLIRILLAAIGIGGLLVIMGGVWTPLVVVPGLYLRNLWLFYWGRAEARRSGLSSVDVVRLRSDRASYVFVFGTWIVAALNIPQTSASARIVGLIFGVAYVAINEVRSRR